MPQAKPYETTADVAQHIRQALKDAFPGVKFSVRSSNYSMGSSVRVTWTDGPTHAQVEAIAKAGEHVRRDDSGDILSGGNRFVFVDRDVSPELERKALAIARERYGIREVVAADLLDYDDARRYREVLSEMDAHTPPTTPQVKRTASPKKDKPATIASGQPVEYETPDIDGEPITVRGVVMSPNEPGMLRVATEDERALCLVTHVHPEAIRLITAPAAVDAPTYHLTGIASWLTFPAEAPADVVALLNGAGWRYSRKRDAYYHEQRTSPPAGVAYVAK